MHTLEKGYFATLGVIVVHEGFSTYETWPFECLRCLRVWEEEYLVQRMSDGHGNEALVWALHGMIVQPPWSGMVCPECGCGSVTTFPTGYLAHQRGAVARSASEPELSTRPRSPLAPHAITALSLLIVAVIGVFDWVRVR